MLRAWSAILLFAFMLASFSFPRDAGEGIYIPDKKTADTSLINSEQNKKPSLSYALRLSNIQNINSPFNIDIPADKFEKPAGFMLEDGTTWSFQDNVDQARLLGMAGFILTVEAVGYSRLKELWYDWPTTKIHSTNFKTDFVTYKLMDKYGHFMHAYFATDLFSRGYRWAGISGEKSTYYGALSGWLWMLQIELADAFFEAWGFSWGDLMFNTLGSGFSLMQQLYPEAFGGLQPKVSYHKSQALKEKKYINGAKTMIDDYEGLTWWLGINVFHYLPHDVQEDYPGWLKPFGVAIGYSAKGIANDPQGGFREIFLGLDYDFRKLSFGDENGFIKFLKNELNIIRLPLPAVKITPGGVWYGLYF